MSDWPEQMVEAHEVRILRLESELPKLVATCAATEVEVRSLGGQVSDLGADIRAHAVQSAASIQGLTEALTPILEAKRVDAVETAYLGKWAERGKKLLWPLAVAGGAAVVKAGEALFDALTALPQ